MFPELVNPVQLGVDTRGRLWAATWATYPKWEPTEEMDDRLLILPDENRDGVADTAITFAYVHNPTGFEFWNGGVIVASVPDFLFLKDTDGDDVADVRIRIAGGFGSADTHHSANNFVYGPDGFLYYQRGIFNVSNVETPWSANQESGTSGMYRFNPRTYEFSFHAANSPNPHGISFDYWGYHYATDATGGAAYQVKPNRDGT
jgi:putative membrane-bound dehydrogenase-like protein